MEKTEVIKSRILILLQALVVSFLATLFMLLVLAFLLYKAEPGENMISIGLAATYLISCFLGGFLAGKKIKEKKFLWGLCTGIIYFLLLLGISTILEPGAMAEASYIGSAMALCGGGGTLGGMLS